MRMLYADFKKDNSTGFSDSRIKEICETVNGKNLDEFWVRYITGTEDLPVDSYLKLCGIELKNENESLNCSLDIEPLKRNGKLIAGKVFSGGSAYEAGINANDEIIAVNGHRVDLESIGSILENYTVGNEINVLISRSGIIKEKKVKLIKPLPKYKIIEMETKNDEQIRYLNKWING